VVTDGGNVYDSDRVMFYASLTQLQRATSEGVAAAGYFLWNARDNLEWTDGFGHPVRADPCRLRHPGTDPEAQREGFRQAARQTAVVGRFAGIPRWLEERDDCRHTRVTR
jgi:hypothetical protein